jgi:lysophospholipase L1-like esterase
MERVVTSFEYSNLSDRAPGRFVSLAARVLPGVRAVQRQTEPYALAWQRDNEAALAAEGPLWVALGDSMTVGIGAGAHDRGWVGQLAGRLPGWRVLNLAMTGGRVRDVLDRQLPALDQLPVAPELVTVLVGSNDLMSPRHRRQVTGDLAELLTRLPAGSVVGNQPGTFAAAVEFDRQIDAAVADRGLVLAEFRDPRTRSWKGRLAADHFHPNERGYAGIAAVFEEAVARALR